MRFIDCVACLPVAGRAGRVLGVAVSMAFASGVGAQMVSTPANPAASWNFGKPAASPAVDYVPIAQAPAATTPATASVPSHGMATSMAEYRLRLAEKIRNANLPHMFQGKLPAILASVPVIHIELNGDGTVKKLDVLRTPKFYPETIELAKRAIERAMPFDSIAHLPHPWTINETFLFNDNMKFQLHTLQDLK